MGTWGPGPFENDDASDWLYSLEDSSGPSTVREALDVAAVGYLELYMGAVTIAAAEVVAAASGHPSAAEPDAVREWVNQYGGEFGKDDIRAAIAAIDRAYSEQSEIRHLWEDTGRREWNEAVEGLRRRLVDALA